MSLRTELRDLLTNRLPEWDVRADLRGVDAPEAAPIVLVETSRFTPGPARGRRTVELTVYLLTPLTDPETVDDDLEARLAELLAVLEHLDPIAWTEATRGVYDERLHCYTVTVTAPARKD